MVDTTNWTDETAIANAAFIDVTDSGTIYDDSILAYDESTQSYDSIGYSTWVDIT